MNKNIDLSRFSKEDEPRIRSYFVEMLDLWSRVDIDELAPVDVDDLHPSYATMARRYNQLVMFFFPEFQNSSYVHPLYSCVQ